MKGERRENFYLGLHAECECEAAQRRPGLAHNRSRRAQRDGTNRVHLPACPPRKSCLWDTAAAPRTL